MGQHQIGLGISEIPRLHRDGDGTMNKRLIMKQVLTILLMSAALTTPPAIAEDVQTFQTLPEEVRTHALEVRQRCKEAFPEEIFEPMQGIDTRLSLNDGSKIIIVDDEKLCQAANGHP